MWNNKDGVVQCGGVALTGARVCDPQQCKNIKRSRQFRAISGGM